MTDKKNELFKFLLCEGKIFGKFLPDIWEYSDTQLECNHDYIQLVFPIDTVSSVNGEAPIVNEDDLLLYQERLPQIRENMRKSFRRMLEFYGLMFDDSGEKIVLCDDFDKKHIKWIGVWSHNYLRITRILKSLCIFGLSMEASAFLEVLVELSNMFPSMKKSCEEYWVPALKTNGHREG